MNRQEDVTIEDINEEIKALNKDINKAINKLKKSQNREMLRSLRDEWSYEIETTSKEALALTRSNLVDNLIGKMAKWSEQGKMVEWSEQGKMVEWSEHDKMRSLKEVKDNMKSTIRIELGVSELGKKIVIALEKYTKAHVNTGGGNYKMSVAKNDPVSLLVSSMIEFMLNENENEDFESSGALLAFIFAMITVIFIVRADRAR